MSYLLNTLSPDEATEASECGAVQGGKYPDGTSPKAAIPERGEKAKPHQEKVDIQ